MRTQVRIRPETVVQRARDPEFSRLDDETLAVDVQAQQCYSLNLTGSRVWDLIESPVSVQAVCAALGSEYEVDERTCFQDVAELLEGLARAGLVTLSNAPQA